MIPLFRPKYETDAILAALRPVLESGWTGMGQKTLAFEAAMAGYIGAPYSVFLNSGTAALHLALTCIDNSYVIVPDITFVSTAAAVLHAGHIPILAPVDCNMQIDLDWLAQAIWPRKKVHCVIPVHYSGNTCDLDRLQAICAGKAAIIEDCAHALGTRYKGRHVGTFGDFGCFSHHAVKNLPIADGGTLVAKPEYEDRLRRLRWLGIDRTTHERSAAGYEPGYEIGELGFKCHGNDLMATVGLEQLKVLNQHQLERFLIYCRYEANFPFPVHQPNEGVLSSHHLITATVPDADAFAKYMSDRGIQIGRHYRPLSSFEYYRRFADEETRERSWRQYQSLVSLPCFVGMTMEQVDRVCDRVCEEAGKFNLQQTTNRAKSTCL